MLTHVFSVSSVAVLCRQGHLCVENRSNMDVSLAGWRLVAEDSGATYDFPEDSILGANSKSIVWWGSANINKERQDINQFFWTGRYGNLRRRLLFFRYIIIAENLRVGRIRERDAVRRRRSGRQTMTLCGWRTWSVASCRP